MQLEKPITPDPRFIKPFPNLATKIKLFLTDGMVITVFHFMKITITLLLSSHHKGTIVIKLHHRATSPQKMALHFDEIVSDVQNMTKCVDDSLLRSDD